MKRISLFFAATILFIPLFLNATSFREDAKVNWLTMEEAEALALEEPRMIFVDVYTDWCGFCRRMTAETYSHPVIAAYLNENFYPVKFNAEQHDPISFQGVEYVNKNPGQRRSAHDFAIAILQGRLSYPTVVFFDEDIRLLTALPGFRPPKSMEAVLAFFSTHAYEESSDLQGFIEGFVGSVD